MLLHKLISCFRKHGGGSEEFFAMQAADAVVWLQGAGVPTNERTTVLDLGAGFGDVGGELARLGCRVTLADDDSFVREKYRQLPFVRFNIDADDFGALGQYDLVVCSNVLEHLRHPERLMAAIPRLLTPTGRFYLSWTNWLSPWGGHEYSPFHYLGPHLGSKLYDRWVGGQRLHWAYQNLFPTYIGSVLRSLRRNNGLQVLRTVPRYYPEFAFLVHVPGIREFLTWNCVVLLARRDHGR